MTVTDLLGGPGWDWVTLAGMLILAGILSWVCSLSDCARCCSP